VKGTRIGAMVLAAGLGTRLRPLTDSMPKPVVPVGGKPLIFYALENLKSVGVAKVVINTHHLAEQVEKAVSSVSWPFEIAFVHEAKILGTGGAIRNAEQHFAGCEAILTHNSDAIVDHDLKPLVDAHLRNGPLATMLLRESENIDAFGAVSTDTAGQVRDIVGQVGYTGLVAKRLMYCGVQVLSPQIFDVIPQEGSFCILRQGLIPALKNGYTVRYQEMHGFFCDVGNKERLDFANARFAALKQVL